MATITLSEHAPSDQGDITFGFAQGDPFTLTPGGAGVEVTDEFILGECATHPWLEVNSQPSIYGGAAPADEPAADESTDPFNFDLSEEN